MTSTLAYFSWVSALAIWIVLFVFVLVIVAAIVFAVLDR